MLRELRVLARSENDLPPSRQVYSNVPSALQLSTKAGFREYVDFTVPLQVEVFAIRGSARYQLIYDGTRGPGAELKGGVTSI